MNFTFEDLPEEAQQAISELRAERQAYEPSSVSRYGGPLGVSFVNGYSVMISAPDSEGRYPMGSGLWYTAPGPRPRVSEGFAGSFPAGEVAGLIRRAAGWPPHGGVQLFPPTPPPAL